MEEVSDWSAGSGAPATGSSVAFLSRIACRCRASMWAWAYPEAPKRSSPLIIRIRIEQIYDFFTQARALPGHRATIGSGLILPHLIENPPFPTPFSPLLRGGKGWVVPSRSSRFVFGRAPRCAQAGLLRGSRGSVSPRFARRDRPFGAPFASLTRAADGAMTYSHPPTF